MARRAAEESTCRRRHVGAILVRDDELVGSGANVPPKGSPSCEELGICFESGGPCQATLHAAVNLILATTPTERAGATVVMTIRPCLSCAMMLASSGIAELIYDAPYREDEEEVVEQIIAAAEIKMRQLRPL
jgi:dCMP deaminase